MSAILKAARSRVATAGVGLIVCLGLAGCGSAAAQPGSGSAVSAAPSPSVSPSPSTAGSQTAAAVGVVARVVLSTSDVASGYVVKLIPGGDQVAGQVTLDYCGYHYTSETHRVARRQVALYTSAGQAVGASNEVVAYDTSAHAAEALAQFTAAVKRCPTTAFERGTVAGQPAVRYDKGTLSTSTQLPVPGNVIVMMTATAKGFPGHLYSVFVMQVEGTVLDAVYLSSSAVLPPSAIAAAMHVAVVTGQRIPGGSV